MIKHTVGILGGTGFVGHHLASKLVKQGHNVIILSRRPERHRDLTVLPTLELKKIKYFDDNSLKSALSGCDVVINLIGILNSTDHSGKEFRSIHVDLTQIVVKTCKALGIKRYLHMSALGANQSRGPSYYLRSKGQAEDWIHQQASEDFTVTSFRPSIIFGPGDNFFNHFAGLFKITPVVPLPCAKTKYAPVFVGDVVNIIADAIDEPNTFGQRLDLVGPKIYTLLELMKYLKKLTNSKTIIIPLGNTLSGIMAFIFEYMPGKPFSLDNFRSAKEDSISTQSLPDSIKWSPCELQVVIETYLGKNVRSEIFSEYRMLARR